MPNDEPCGVWACHKCELTITQPLAANAVGHMPDKPGIRREIHWMTRVLPGSHIEGEPGRTTVARHP